MGQIYAKANRTVVWLGEEVDEFGDCGNAMRDSHRLCKEMDKYTRKDGSLDKKKLRVLREEKSGVDWGAMERLLLRPWWRRVWTLQEFLISKHVWFYCGKQSISSLALQDAIYVMWACKVWNGLMSTQAFYAGWNRRRMDQWQEKRPREMGLVAILAYVGDSGATDERDRVYSVLGVAKDGDLMRTLHPDSTAEDVYTELVESFIWTYKSLDIICYSHLFNHSAREPDEKRFLPSWIPDWRAKVESKVIPVMASQGSNPGTGNFRPAWVTKSEAVYRASGHKLPIYEVSKDGKVLSCTGVVLDRITGLGGSKYNDAGEITDATKEIPVEQSEMKCDKGLGELTKIISRCLVLDREDRYLAETMAPDIFREDLERFCRFYFQYPSESPPFFREWFKRNKSLLIQGRTLESHCREATLNTPVPTLEHLNSGSLKYFYGRLEDTVVAMARRIAVTENGHFGMAASRATRGDLVCVLFGCSIPVLLREQEDGTFEFIGECFVDGFMTGEALNGKRGLAEVTFRIV